jgi:hypothetical protein
VSCRFADLNLNPRNSSDEPLVFVRNVDEETIVNPNEFLKTLPPTPHSTCAAERGHILKHFEGFPKSSHDDSCPQKIDTQLLAWVEI